MPKQKVKWSMFWVRRLKWTPIMINGTLSYIIPSFLIAMYLQCCVIIPMYTLLPWYQKGLLRSIILQKIMDEWRIVHLFYNSNTLKQTRLYRWIYIYICFVFFFIKNQRASLTMIFFNYFIFCIIIYSIINSTIMQRLMQYNRNEINNIKSSTTSANNWNNTQMFNEHNEHNEHKG